MTFRWIQLAFAKLHFLLLIIVVTSCKSTGDTTHVFPYRHFCEIRLDFSEITLWLIRNKEVQNDLSISDTQRKKIIEIEDKSNDSLDNDFFILKKHFENCIKKNNISPLCCTYPTHVNNQILRDIKSALAINQYNKFIALHFHVYGPQIIMVLEKALPDDLLHEISLSSLQREELTNTVNDFYNSRKKYVAFLGRSVISEWPSTSSRDEYNQYISDLNSAYNSLKEIEILYDKKIWKILTESQRNTVLDFLAKHPVKPPDFKDVCYSHFLKTHDLKNFTNK